MIGSGLPTVPTEKASVSGRCVTLHRFISRQAPSSNDLISLALTHINEALRSRRIILRHKEGSMSLSPDEFHICMAIKSANL